jgi:hypothetical protein
MRIGVGPKSFDPFHSDGKEIKIRRTRAMLENNNRRRGTYFPRPGPRFCMWMPGTPVYARFTRHTFWMTNWYEEIRKTNKRKPVR